MAVGFPFGMLPGEEIDDGCGGLSERDREADDRGLACRGSDQHIRAMN